MKLLVLSLELILIGCSGTNEIDQNDDQNNKDQNSPSSDLAKSNSIESPNGILHKLDRDLMLNKMHVLDSFVLEKFIEQVDKPDSLIVGGADIRAEFGADDYTLFIGKSEINAGHGHLLFFEVKDRKLNLEGLKIGSTRRNFEEILGLDFPKKSKINSLGIGDDVYIFSFHQDKIWKIEYYAPPV